MQLVEHRKSFSSAINLWHAWRTQGWVLLSHFPCFRTQSTTTGIFSQSTYSCSLTNAGDASPVFIHGLWLLHKSWVWMTACTQKVPGPVGGRLVTITGPKPIFAKQSVLSINDRKRSQEELGQITTYWIWDQSRSTREFNLCSFLLADKIYYCCCYYYYY